MFSLVTTGHPLQLPDYIGVTVTKPFIRVFYKGLLNSNTRTTPYMELLPGTSGPHFLSVFGPTLENDTLQNSQGMYKIHDPFVCPRVREIESVPISSSTLPSSQKTTDPYFFITIPKD